MGQKRKPAVDETQREKSVKRAKPQKEPAKKKDVFAFQPRPDWHAADLPQLESKEVKLLPPQWMIDTLYERGEKLLQEENSTYNSSHLTGSSSHKFLSTIMTSGTLEDRISALTLLVQESPVHTMKALENLLSLASKRSRGQALMAVAALKDLFGQGILLPADRKLRTFAKQPSLVSALQGVTKWKPEDPLPNGLKDIHLMVWAFEDWLKKKFFELLQTLETWCNDEVEYARGRAVTYVWELLKEKPEQEENLLRLLVHKLSDSSKKIASRTSYLILQLETTHPAMKETIINSIEADCLFRTGQSLHGKYYGIITINQTILSSKEESVANKLVKIYFSLFVQLLKKPSTAPKFDSNQGGGGKAGKMAAKKRKAAERAVDTEVQLRESLVAQVLSGVNRAFPYSDATSAEVETQIDTLFRVTHSANFNTAVQALMLLQQISSSRSSGADRFYRTLYESLLDPRLATSSKQMMYLNLLYKSLKADVDIKRVQAFVKRILQITVLHEPAFVCSLLYLVSELGQTFSSIGKMIEEAELDLDDEVEHFVDADAPVDEKMQSLGPRYDPRKRDPGHARAELSALWELTPISSHYHPSVAVYAQASLGHQALPAKPDPEAHTLKHFLDRFVYRNPKTKASAGTHGSSIMQPSAGSAAADLLFKPVGPSLKSSMPVNSESFWSKSVANVAPEDVFFHAYFNQAGTKKKRTTKEVKTRKENSDDEEEDDEDEIWKAIAKSRPEVDGPGSDDDLSLGDLESAYDDSEDDGEAGINLAGDEDEDIGGVDLDDEDLESDVPDLESDDGDAVFGDDDEIAFDIDDDEEDDNAEAPGEEQEEISANRARNQNKRKEKKKLKQLPTFASADDYAKLLDDEPDDL